MRRLSRPSLTLSEINRLRGKIARITPSAPWLDHAAAEADRQGILPRSTAVAELLRRWGIFPPPAENTPMLPCRCRRCAGSRLWPAAYMTSRGLSLECALEAGAADVVEEGLPPPPSSPGSVIVMAAYKSAVRRGQQYPN